MYWPQFLRNLGSGTGPPVMLVLTRREAWSVALALLLTLALLLYAAYAFGVGRGLDLACVGSRGEPVVLAGQRVCADSPVLEAERRVHILFEY